VFDVYVRDIDGQTVGAVITTCKLALFNETKACELQEEYWGWAYII
jgi:hypothetical protein